MKPHGVVVARYRRHVTVEDATGIRWLCQTLGRRLSPLAGDDVEWEAQPDGTGIVTRLLPRATELTRSDSRGRREVVAANLTQLIAVAAAEPKPDWFVVDRYLAAAAMMRIAAAVAFNKTDLADTPEPALDEYRVIGYRVFSTSAVSGAGMRELATILDGERSVLVGQSGVGKSSLINALLGDSVQAVDRLTRKGSHGRHTTTTAVLHRLSGGGELVDSPGVRAYTPYLGDQSAIANGYVEFSGPALECRFADCIHAEEPDCGVKRAVQAGRISARRYDSYRKLLELAGTLSARRAP